MKRNTVFFPSILLSPDATDGSSPSNGGADGTQTNNNAQTDENPDAAFDAAAQAAIETVQKSASSTDTAASAAGATTDKTQATDGTPQATDKVQLSNLNAPADGTKVDAAQAAKLDDKGQPVVAPANKPLEAKIDKPGDETLPFNKHPRWHEVTAERDTARTELTALKQQYESVKPNAEAHEGVVKFLQQSRVTPQAYQETLRLRALMETDPEKALPELEKAVEQLRAVVGKGIAPDLLQEVRDGTLSEERAQEITKQRAMFARAQQSEQTFQHQQRAMLVQQMENSVTSWFASKKTADPSFDNKVNLINGMFATLVNQTPPQNSAEVTALLEKAYGLVNQDLGKFAPAKPAVKPPPDSNGARVQQKDPETMDEFAEQAINRILETA